jgi:hypothetical protein
MSISACLLLLQILHLAVGDVHAALPRDENAFIPGSTYWTQEGLRTAEPCELTVDAEPSGEPSGEPMLGACRYYQETLWTDAADYTHAPLPLVGRLFFVQNGRNYSCSGSIGGDSLVWTAGHCVYNPSQKSWAQNVLFVPGAFQHTAPYGYYAAARLFAADRWMKGVLGRDYALVRINGSFPASLGRLTLKTNIPRSLATNYTAYGYPSVGQEDGSYDRSCHSEACFRNLLVRPNSVGISCRSAGGSSGGPWVVDGAWIASVTSYRLARWPTIMYGPYFDGETEAFWQAVQASG